MDEEKLVPADQLSEREMQCLFYAVDGLLTSGERMELLDFLGYPDPMPATGGGRALAVVNRILAARARGEHIA